jgi:hypothetical protein
MVCIDYWEIWLQNLTQSSPCGAPYLIWAPDLTEEMLFAGCCAWITDKYLGHMVENLNPPSPCGAPPLAWTVGPAAGHCLPPGCYCWGLPLHVLVQPHSLHLLACGARFVGGQGSGTWLALAGSGHPPVTERVTQAGGRHMRIRRKGSHLQKRVSHKQAEAHERRAKYLLV